MVRSGGAPDDDVVFMARAPVFVRSGGRLTDLVARLVRSCGGAVVPRPGEDEFEGHTGGGLGHRGRGARKDAPADDQRLRRLLNGTGSDGADSGVGMDHASGVALGTL